MIRLSRRGVVPIRAGWKLAELQRLAAGLGYISETEAPLVAGDFGALTVAALLATLFAVPTVEGNGLEEDDSFRWLEPGALTPWPVPGTGQPLPGLLGKRCRMLLAFFGGLQNTVAFKLGDGPLKRIYFCGRWGESGTWLVLHAQIVET